MSDRVIKTLVVAFAILTYFIAYPDDVQAVTQPIAGVLSLTSAISPWFYGVVAVAIFSLAMVRAWGGPIGNR